MNKRDLIDAISARMGDKKTATEAVNAVLQTTAPVGLAALGTITHPGHTLGERADCPGERPGSRWLDRAAL